MGLGPVSRSNHIDVARSKAEKARSLVKSGVDPLEQRAEDEAVVLEKRETEFTFIEVINKFFISKDKTGYFRTEQTRRRWYFCLTTHAQPLHHIQISKIITKTIYHVLEPLWMVKTETASRTRLYMEAVFS